MKKITDLARVIRSKNAGPYELTLDMIFKTEEIYNAIKEKKLINMEKISSIYKIDQSIIKGIVYFDPANAVKITMKRELPSGAYGDNDIYGAQQHAPLLNLEFDI
ncbi:MAG: DUF4387 domain-containing protein [Deltaproteobacteria bacterium]|nr:DUF4387 domain-containing protein [Deltaproteobacteria bacterium]